MNSNVQGLTAGLFAVCCVLSGCGLSARLTDTLPDAFEEELAPIDTVAGVALRYRANPDADRLEIDLGSVSLRMNRLFSGMVTEMALKKFGHVDKASENRLEVATTYLDLEERAYMGNVGLYRVDMAVTVVVADGERVERREFVHAAVADLEGYSVRSDQLYDLLLHFVSSINAFADAHFREP